MSYTKEDILRSMRDLNNEINACIDNIMLGRGTGNRTLEGNALFKMESIMVGTQQISLYGWISCRRQTTKVVEFNHFNYTEFGGIKKREYGND